MTLDANFWQNDFGKPAKIKYRMTIWGLQLAILCPAGFPRRYLLVNVDMYPTFVHKLNFSLIYSNRESFLPIIDLGLQRSEWRRVSILRARFHRDFGIKGIRIDESPQRRRMGSWDVIWLSCIAVIVSDAITVTARKESMKRPGRVDITIWSKADKWWHCLFLFVLQKIENNTKVQYMCGGNISISFIIFRSVGDEKNWDSFVLFYKGFPRERLP